ncbi:MAG: ATP-grasp domain-containing protein [Planctomycetales bacterium]|nr:ATP-grasp domain-containing protein [Planctomycetales bacterium]
MKRVLVLSPTAWDREELAAPRIAERYAVEFLDGAALRPPERIGLRHLLPGPDLLGHVRRLAERYRGDGVVGVVGTDEWLACAAASVLARDLGLPGPTPEAVLLAQHKYRCREVSREVVPEATPPFALLDPRDLREDRIGLPFPMFVKPVRGTFSVLARRVESFGDLRAFLRFGWPARRAASNILRPFRDLLARYLPGGPTAQAFLGEALLAGALVTVEGLSCDGRHEVIGITDAVMYPGTMSFERFEYPSRLPETVRRRMEEIARRLVARIGLDRTLWNVEVFWDEARDTVHVVEVNPRMAYQFADLYEKVDGVNAYDLQLALATGESPALRRGAGSCGAAASFVLRRFEDGLVTRAPSAEDVARLRAEFPDARVRMYAREGRRLSQLERGVESYRLAIVNLGGRDRADLEARWAAARRHLAFQFR